MFKSWIELLLSKKGEGSCESFYCLAQIIWLQKIMHNEKYLAILSSVYPHLLMISVLSMLASFLREYIDKFL
jgi:hypothetical protein